MLNLPALEMDLGLDTQKTGQTFFSPVEIGLIYLLILSEKDKHELNGKSRNKAK
jgi:hypothetical protein